jgi:chemotaxis protein methyltransferase CheR
LLKTEKHPFMHDLTPEDIHSILSEIYKSTGYDFKDYAAATIKQRLQRRLAFENLQSIGEFIDRIQSSRQFADKLIMDFSINVTAMFRDPEFFNFLRSRILPELRGERFIRIWSAGCATGEEVYSLAILLHEEGIYPYCRIYATDMNENAISQAERGFIPLSKLKAYTLNYFASGGREQFHQYFTFKDEKAYLHADLLKNIIFAHHNLAEDRSFNEFHIICCRNVLIYFNRNLQDHVHDLLYESLAVDGYLALGGRESIRFTKHASDYKNLNYLQKMYQRIH